MPWSCPKVVEVALWNAARARLPAHRLESAALQSAVVARSRMYTSERDELGTPVGDPSDLAARALFFTVADAPKASFAVAELAGRDLLPASSTLRVLDLGAGAGAMSLGLWSWLRDTGDDRRIEVVAVDRDRQALELLSDVAAEIDPAGFAVTSRVADIADKDATDARDCDFDLVLIGTALNELDSSAQRVVVDLALDSIHAGGAVIVIEPALRECARALHTLRDELIGEKVAFVFAPCTRTAAPCPALADADDWCHEDRPAALPSRAAAIARATGLRMHGIKFSYLTLRRSPSAQVAPPESPLVALRVVSHSRRSKGLREAFLCGELGRRRVRLLKRNRSASNRVFEEAARGDVLVMRQTDEIESGDQLERIRIDHR